MGKMKFSIGEFEKKIEQYSGIVLSVYLIKFFK